HDDEIQPHRLLVDAGSAVTVDYVDQDGAFCGGAILPGLRLMAKALHDYTALLPLIEVEDAKAALSAYWSDFTAPYHQPMARKIGFEQADEPAIKLLESLLAQMQQSRTDYTRLFRALGDVQRDGENTPAALRDLFVDREAFDGWLADYRARLRTHAKPDAERRAVM
ncbi:MAG: type III pantothenate kinase, partial [Pseudomonadota bacterium]